MTPAARTFKGSILFCPRGQIPRAQKGQSRTPFPGIFTGLFSLVQIFVAMNPEETLYFANPGMDGKFNRDYFFHWGDFDNNPINDWRKIASVFLSIPMAHQLVASYTIADQAEGTLKVLRSYQYWAVSKITARVAQRRWNDQDMLGGYIEHTTGSGKTLSSFKAAQLIASSSDADKVVFLMDRIELGTQSLLEYRAFAEATDEIQATENTDILISKLKSCDRANNLIVTSIQKMSRIKLDNAGKRRAADIGKIQKKRIVFIVDECHRSVFGEMLMAIKKTFPMAMFFGFTGTPIYDENRKHMNVTEDIFGNQLHRYSVADGISDKNVLGFDHYKILTYRDKDLRTLVGLEKAKAHTIEEAMADERKREVFLRYTSSTEIPMATQRNPDGTFVRGIEEDIPEVQYNCDAHRRTVVKDIKEGWVKLSRNGKFHAILATYSIHEAIEYFRLLRAEMPQLNVTALFDPTIDNGGNTEFKEAGVTEILTNYNETFKREYDLSTYPSFKKEVSLRLAHKGTFSKIDSKPEQQINILIVVNQMLTGFDSKWVNTLYVDKILEYENLIQAFSRTNRLFGLEKPFGVIRYYRRPHTMERNIKAAFKLYSGEKPYGLFAQPLAHNLRRLNEIFGEIKYLFDRAGVKDFAKLPDADSEKARFAKLFRQFSQILEAARIQGFIWEQSHYSLKMPNGSKEIIDMAIDEATYKILAKRYKELLTGGGGGGTTEVPYDIDPYLIEIDTGVYDAQYMNERFNKFLKVIDKGDATPEERSEVVEELHKSFANLSQEEQKYANIFLQDVESGDVALESGKDFYEYVVEYMNRAKNDQIHRVATLFGLDEDKLRVLMNSDVNADNLNEYNRFTALKDTVDRMKAKEYFDRVEATSLPIFRVNSRVDQLLKIFILSGGAQPDFEPAVYEPSDPEYSAAAEDVVIYGNGVDVILRNTKREELMGNDLDLVLMYAIAPGKARENAQNAGKLAIGINDDNLTEEAIKAYTDTDYILFHYWKNSEATAFKLTSPVRVVEPGAVPEGFAKKMKQIKKFLLVEYDPSTPAEIGELDILPVQRQGKVRYTPFVTKTDSIRKH